MKRVIVLIGVLLLAGCATTDSSVKQDSSSAQDSSAKQDSSNTQGSCVEIYASEVGTGEIGKLARKAYPVSATININKNRLYFGELLEGHECKPHKSAALWNCAEPDGMIVAGLSDNQTARFKKVYDYGSALEFINPRWKFVSCPE